MQLRFHRDNSDLARGIPGVGCAILPRVSNLKAGNAIAVVRQRSLLPSHMDRILFSIVGDSKREVHASTDIPVLKASLELAYFAFSRSGIYTRTPLFLSGVARSKATHKRSTRDSPAPGLARDLLACLVHTCLNAESEYPKCICGCALTARLFLLLTLSNQTH